MKFTLLVLISRYRALGFVQVLDEVLDDAVIAIIDCFVLESHNNFNGHLVNKRALPSANLHTLYTLNLLSVASGMHIIVYFTL